MSLAGPTALALVRALFVAALAITVAAPLSAWLAAQRGRTRTLAWALLLAPFFTPALLISYAFSRLALALAASPWSHEALYLGALGLKLIPIAVVVRILLPSPLSLEARHAHRLLAIASWKSRALFRLRGAGAGPWIAAGLVFLPAFADFELASLWSVRTWTVTIFDAQIGGLALRETLRLASGPLAVQLAVLALVASRRHDMPREPRAGRPRRQIVTWLYLGASASLVALVPLGIVTAQAAAGWRALAAHFVLAREIGVSALLAAGAALAAGTLAQSARRSGAATVLLAAPGLLGALAISLLVLALFQTAPLRPAYDTPLPLALALTLVLLPLALLLSALGPSRTPALHLAQQTGSRRLLWPMQTRPRAVALGLLFCWAYFDFTASSILAPIGLTPVFVRLHNLAHYGQTAVLSAMLLAAFVVPVAGVSVSVALARLFAGRR